MAIVNSFIVYRERQKEKGEPLADHAGVSHQLQAHLLHVTASDFVEPVCSTCLTLKMLYILPTDIEILTWCRSNKLIGFPEWTHVHEGVCKSPQHQCKVCSIRKRKLGQRRATRFFCETYSDGNKRVYLCDRIRPQHYTGNNMTCHHIRYIKWKNGEGRPRPRVGRDIQMRDPSKKSRRH
ncbi:hypothetical protein PHMEG_0006167 [Phytophthora megakarya]|uniref:Uncharacterized protein n=1 Tax=Phytophthora megakarya TaxID=4795 RepID=A0A225WQQ4_9STRA|nr:hypothetical protein PHMEG_0006167 [Phytophthora megakarya]